MKKRGLVVLKLLGLVGIGLLQIGGVLALGVLILLGFAAMVAAMFALMYSLMVVGLPGILAAGIVALPSLIVRGDFRWTIEAWDWWSNHTVKQIMRFVEGVLGVEDSTSLAYGDSSSGDFFPRLSARAKRWTSDITR